MTTTPSLFSESNSKFEIKKHSSLVQIGSIATSQERKSMNALIRIAKDILKRDPDCKYFVSDIGVVKRLIGFNSNDTELLKNALRNLKRTEIEYNVLNKDKEEWGIFSFLAEVKILSQGRGRTTTVSFEFPRTILNVIKHPSMYVKLDLYIIRGLESKHSIALYEVMKDYQNLGYYNCGVDAFKKLMGLEEGQYKIFTMLKKRVLQTAVTEINLKTDIEISYELIREGRKVVSIQFKVDKAVKPIEGSNSELEAHVKEKLKIFGISEKQITKLIQKHDHQYLLANIRIVEDAVSKGGIKSPKAYLMKAIQNDFRDSKDIQKEVKSVKLPDDNFKIQELKNAERIRFSQMKAYVDGLEVEEYDSLKAMFLESVNSNIFFQRLYSSKGFDDKIIQTQRFKYVEMKKAEEVL